MTAKKKRAPEIKTHPVQPIEPDEHGTLRFKKNAIVRHLLDNGEIHMNEIARLPFSDEDRQQFAQLIGYSLNGYSELSYVSDEAFGTASAMADSADERDAIISTLQEMLERVRAGLKIAAPAVFRIHPDDLET